MNDAFLVLLRLTMQLVDQLRRFLVHLIVVLVKFYQLAISPLIGPCCRFTPTCSQYCVLAVQKYGVVVGLLKTTWRILRCNPFCKGGYDPP